jgi:transglutaminase-like putative cysteine protease
MRCLRLLVLLAAGSVPATGAWAAGRTFLVKPPSTWVQPLPLPDVSKPPAADSTGTRYLLFDQQIRAGEGDQETYHRAAWTVETTAGLQDSSEIAITFDPSFERLCLHHARVVRAGSTVWSAVPGDVRIAHTEADADARLYSDDLTATVLVRGLRVGDTVDYAYTLEGLNPVLAGHLDTVLWFEYSRPVDRVRRRILWQRRSTLRFRAHGRAPEPTVTLGAEGTVYEWEARDTRAVQREDRTPGWFQPDGRVEASDFDGWSDVVRRSRELFAATDEKAPAIDALVRSFRLEDASEDARIDRAVRFVQDDVRYLGLEMGPHSHQPHRPADTLARRFGDCKDKATLLVAILRRLGVEASPALVSTQSRQALDQRLPSLFAFDHVIVAIDSAGTRLFVDATASEQGGAVRDRRPPRFARALVVEEGGAELVPIPRPPVAVATTEVSESYVTTAWGQPTRLDVVTTYRGTEADDVRQSQARSTRAEMGKRYRDFYAQEHDGIRALGPPQVEDDRERNVVVVREAYEVPALWKQGAHDFRAWLVDERLVEPRSRDRSTPFALFHPERVHHSLTIRLPGPPDLEPFRETVKGAAFSVEASASVQGNEAHLEYVYESLADSVPPRGVEAFVGDVDRAANIVVCRVGVPRRAAAGTGATSPEDDSLSAWLGLAMLGGCGAAFVWMARARTSSWRARRRRAAFAARTRAGEGEEPRRAILVDSADRIDREGVGGTCGCGGPWREIDRATISYEGGPMTVATWQCDRCARERTLYFRIV